jgi:hypothetical protein
MDIQELIRHDDEAAAQLTPERSDDGFDFSVATNGR